jgi:hypothetical protein
MRFGFSTPFLTMRLRLPGLPRRFSFGTFLMFIALAAALLAWRRDHLELRTEIAQLRGEQLRRDKANANWGVEQLVGEPDTDSYGDNMRAWASQTQDSREEWILVDFAEAVTPASIEVYETYNPGALTKVSIIDPLGREVVVWTGTDPTQPPAAGGVSKLAVSTIWQTRQGTPGWNEIDTIGLVDTKGKTHWPINATASSAYGGRESSRMSSYRTQSLQFGGVQPRIIVQDEEQPW